MGSEWSFVRLGDYCSKIGSGATPKGGSGVYLDEGEISLIRSQNVYNSGFSESGLVFITNSAADKLKNVVVEPNDILLNITGDSVARVCMVDESYLPARVNQHVTIIRVDPKEFDARFVRYFLSTEYAQSLLLTLASAGATRNALTKSMIEDFLVPKPPLEKQVAIADSLAALDQKISLNRQINTTLESMAQALFKSWFVDFDPVIDNALAAGHEIPDELQARADRRRALLSSNTETAAARLPQDIQQLFPDRFVFTEEMGWVPEGWEVKKLGDFAEKISKGTTPSKAVLAEATEAASVPFIKVKDLDDYGDIKTEGLEHIPACVHKGALKRSILRSNDVLFSIAGTIGRVAILPAYLHDSNTNQAVAFVRPSDQNMTTYISMLLRSEQIQGLVNSRVVQAVQANFSLTELASVPVLNAGSRVFDLWHEQSKAWFAAIELNRSSSSCLANLRDSLLPKLLSGQLSIPEAEQALDEVI